MITDLEINLNKYDMSVLTKKERVLVRLLKDKGMSVKIADLKEFFGKDVDRRVRELRQDGFIIVTGKTMRGDAYYSLIASPDYRRGKTRQRA